MFQRFFIIIENLTIFVHTAFEAFVQATGPTLEWFKFIRPPNTLLFWYNNIDGKHWMTLIMNTLWCWWLKYQITWFLWVLSIGHRPFSSAAAWEHKILITKSFKKFSTIQFNQNHFYANLEDKILFPKSCKKSQIFSSIRIISKGTLRTRSYFQNLAKNLKYSVQSESFLREP